MAKKNRTCLACQTKYSYCPSCSNSNRLSPSWKSRFCCEDCMTLWMTLTRFNMGMHTKSEAKYVISGINMKPVETYVPCVQRDLAVIMAEEPKRRSRRALLHIEEEQVEETIREVVETE